MNLKTGLLPILGFNGIIYLVMLAIFLLTYTDMFITQSFVNIMSFVSSILAFTVYLIVMRKLLNEQKAVNSSLSSNQIETQLES